MRLGIRAKLFGGFAEVLALVALIGAIGWRSTTDLAAGSKNTYYDQVVGAIPMGRAQRALYELRIGATANAFATADGATRVQTKAKDEQWLAQVNENMRAFAASGLVAEEAQRLATW